jgi:phosphonate transport system substrate-binding protein
MRLLTAIAAMLVAAGACAGPLVIGAISRHPTEEIARYHPLATYLAARLADFGIEGGKVVVVTSIPQLGELMSAGGADLMFDSPYPTLAVGQLAGSKVLLRRWKGGKASYRSLVIVRAQSPIVSPADLRGRVIAFEDTYSTSGYFLPAATLQRAGFALRELASPGARSKAEEIGYVFSDGYANSLTWLLHGRADAAGVGEHDYERFLARETAQLRIVMETPSVPRNLVSARRDLAPAMVARIVELLLELEHTDEGKSMLKALERTTRFDKLTAEDEKNLEAMRRMMKQAAAKR